MASQGLDLFCRNNLEGEERWLRIGTHSEHIVILKLSLNHREVLLFKPLALAFLAQNTTCIILSSEPSLVIIVTCQQWKHPALAPMAYFWKELHGFTIIAETGREKGESSRRRNLFNLDEQIELPWTPCCFGQARVPVTSCLTLMLSAKFPEGNSCHCLWLSVSAHSTWGHMPISPFHEASHLPSTYPRCWVQWR